MKRVISDTRFPIKVWATDLEPEAEEQCRKLASMPFLAGPVALMADAHAGRGSTIGSVIATKGAIIPSAVGVDIGCGMCAVQLPFKIDAIKDLPGLRHTIERSIPTGRHGNKAMSDRVGQAVIGLGLPEAVAPDSRVFKNALLQLGSLGGGNHFIEICRDGDENAWLMLHSGSRNIGKHLADLHINNAKGIMAKYFIDLPDPELAYLAQGTPEYDSYMHDLFWAQGFAKANRNEMVLKALAQISRHVYGEEKPAEEMTAFRVDCHHNYTSIEHHNNRNVMITRKGAVSAKEGEYGIIPGSMGTGSFIVMGKGNQDSYHSCSHGAGRKMSRTKARATFTLADLEKQTDGVECRKDKDIIDEIPGAYKDIHEVMANQSDLVAPIYHLKQVLCIKGD